MIKIKNTNNYDENIICNGVHIVISANMVMEVNEIVLENLPKGVVVHNELLLEVPYDGKEILEKHPVGGVGTLLTEII
jgi:hypothetical protein